jgi:hypothetical protein
MRMKIMQAVRWARRGIQTVLAVQLPPAAANRLRTLRSTEVHGL